MSKKPVFKNYSSNVSDYLEDLSVYLKNNPNDNNAKADLLLFNARKRNCLEFEKLLEQYSEIDNHHIQAHIAKYYIFKKHDILAAKKHLNKSIEINIFSPMWVYYYAGRTFNYYEKLCENLLYTAIPKNGSTSLKNFILDKVYSTPDKNPHSQFGNPFFKSYHYGEKEIKESKKVLVIRDPISRVKSYYNKNIVEERSLSFELGLSPDTTDFFGLPLVPTFEYFLDNIWDYCWVFNDVLHHILPQSAYVKNLSEYDVVVDLKSLDFMVKKVSDFLGLNYSGPAPHKMVPSSKNVREVTHDDEFLYHIYNDDYILLQDYYTSGLMLRLHDDEASFSPASSYFGMGERLITDGGIKNTILAFFNQDINSLKELNVIKNYSQQKSSKIVENFDAEVVRANFNIDRTSNQNLVDEDNFLLAVASKVKKGVSEVQDEMLKSNKLEVRVGNKSIYSEKSLILSFHLIALPFLYENNVFFVFFAGFNSQIVAVFNLKEMTYTSFVSQAKQQPPVNIQLPSNTAVKLLLNNIFEFSYEIFSYLTKKTHGRGVILGVQHIGHGLWNDLTGIQRIEDNGLIKLVRSFVVLRGADPYGLMQDKFDIRKDLGLVRYSSLQWKEQVANFYYNNLLWCRVTDNYISDRLAEKIIGQKIISRSLKKEEVKVVFGLRMENRTWENQKEGWLNVVNHLVKRFRKITIVIDGHNTSKTSGNIRSKDETSDFSIVDQENELATYLSEQSYLSDVTFINCIGSTLVSNVKAVNDCDFFIAPWGAGLSKLKWVCNLPGIVLTSRANLKYRSDLHIYNSPEYREVPTETVFLNEKYVKDVGDASAIIKTGSDQRGNFVVDIEGLLSTLDNFIDEKIGAK